MDTSFVVELTQSPSQDLIKILRDGINQDSFEKEIKSSVEPFAVFIKGKDQKIIAGCNGFLVYGAIYIAQLWVDSAYRKQGLAKAIMKKVHEYGGEKGCKISTLRTMSFQTAKGFYERLGYVTQYEEKGYEDGNSCFYLRKKL